QPLDLPLSLLHCSLFTAKLRRLAFMRLLLSIDELRAHYSTHCSLSMYCAHIIYCYLLMQGAHTIPCCRYIARNLFNTLPSVYIARLSFILYIYCAHTIQCYLLMHCARRSEEHT